MMDRLATFEFVTDTATLAVFDPQRLSHRLHDDADWWSVPAEEMFELNLGNLVAVSTGSDGKYRVEVAGTHNSEEHVQIEALVGCDSGRLFLGPGEVIPSDGLATTDEYGGMFQEMVPGTYRLYFSRPGFWNIRVCLERVDAEARNSFNDVLQLDALG